MKKILAAVDGSAQSLAAAQLAFELGKASGAEVTLLHVVPPLIFPGEEPYAAMPELLTAQKQRAEKLVAEAKAKLPAAHAVVAEGAPAAEIVRVADELNVDLIVVGSHGRGAVARLLVGSVADRVVHLAKRPVLVVK